MWWSHVCVELLSCQGRRFTERANLSMSLTNPQGVSRLSNMPFMWKSAWRDEKQLRLDTRLFPKAKPEARGGDKEREIPYILPYVSLLFKSCLCAKWFWINWVFSFLFSPMEVVVLSWFWRKNIRQLNKITCNLWMNDSMTHSRCTCFITSLQSLVWFKHKYILTAHFHHLLA